MPKSPQVVVPLHLTAGRSQSSAGIDACKGLACLLIVWHHLAFYGPMSDVVHPAAPALMDWLYQYARMAVQVFLVLGGFLSATLLSRPGSTKRWPATVCRRVLGRYQRLAPTYFSALVVAVAVSAVLRPWFGCPCVPNAPTWPQLLAHAFFLQDLTRQSSLSAGLWYVAIDFQLYAAAALICTLAQQTCHPARWAMAAVALLSAASLWVFNRQTSLDVTALYFFGAYGLGMLARWAVTSKTALPLLVLIAVLGGVALAIEFRGRVTLAWVTALALVVAQRRSGCNGGMVNSLASSRQRWWIFTVARPVAVLAWAGSRSYAIFLIHFPACLLVNAVVSHFWPESVAVNALGLVWAFALSVWAGALMHRAVASRHWRQLRQPEPGLVS